MPLLIAVLLFVSSSLAAGGAGSEPDSRMHKIMRRTNEQTAPLLSEGGGGSSDAVRASAAGAAGGSSVTPRVLDSLSYAYGRNENNEYYRVHLNEPNVRLPMPSIDHGARGPTPLFDALRTRLTLQHDMYAAMPRGVGGVGTVESTNNAARARSSADSTSEVGSDRFGEAETSSERWYPKEEPLVFSPPVRADSQMETDPEHPTHPGWTRSPYFTKDGKPLYSPKKIMIQVGGGVRPYSPIPAGWTRLEPSQYRTRSPSPAYSSESNARRQRWWKRPLRTASGKLKAFKDKALGWFKGKSGSTTSTLSEHLHEGARPLRRRRL
ncbi:hypothetical protein sr11227 [Sporisorium reilianum SRZ2]|uniref:Uncharacterized protein n=1 Tax=Sporisorium reilianum (strain SRZ2) TaxID=999809 RepID=E6ZM97_SPORE|nr:hypothetical protein sr11227 [Sporisorium reilianum SRZ2]